MSSAEVALSPASSGSRRSRRVLKVSALFIVGALLLVTAGHVGPLRPWLARLGNPSAVCPVVGKLTPAEIESQRANASQVLLTGATTPAQQRFAAPFVILTSTRGEVETWAAAAKVTCTDEIANTALRCRDVPSRALAAGDMTGAPGGSDVFVRFDPAGKLVGFDVMRSATSAGAAASLASELTTRIERAAGPRTKTNGKLDAAYLEAPGMRMSSVEFRFSDYAADVSVSRLEERGDLTVREQYRAVSSPSAR